MTINAGARFAHYEIVAPLGAGGMGEVYLARDVRLERQVALKLLPAEFTTNQERLRRFEQEAKAASATSHPNILTIYEIGQASSEAGAVHFIATEYVEGRTLRQQMAGEKLPLAAALDIAVQTASALNAAHAAKIIHRDIKPENVMLRRDGIVKVLDFGLAKLTEKATPAVDSEAATLAKVTTDPGAVMGTPQYMSPEQARGQKVDARTDVFSLGVLLYEMLAGGAPFDGVNAIEVMGAILHQEPAPLKQHVTDAPRELEHIVSKALRKDREQRYQTMKDLLIDLQDLKEELAFAAKLERAGQTVRNEAVTTPAEAVPTTAGSAAKTTSSAKIILGEIKRHKLGIVLTLTLLLAAVGGYFAFFARGPIDSLAILPFTNASGDPEMEYLSDGLTESLINSLAQLPRLRVLPRTTVFRFKGKTDDPQRIGKELGVRAVLTGRVQQRGDRLVIQTELIDVTGEATLWGERYDRKLADLLATQREVAQAIAGGLRLKLSGAEQQQLAKRGTENNEAYQLYLKGMFWRNKREQENLRKAIEYFNQALEKDPNYAPAHAGLADSYIYLGFNAISKENYAKGKAAALKAVALDGNLAEAHTALGRSLFYFDWDFAGAEKEFKRAVELDPDSAIAHGSYANYLSALGRHQEAIAEADRALQLDPLTTTTNSIVELTYLYARLYDQAIDQCRKLLEMDRGFAVGYRNLSWAYQGKGQYEEAIATAQAGLKVAPDNLAILGQLGLAYAGVGRRGEAQKILAQLLPLANQREMSGGLIAPLYAALDDKDQAFVWLEKAYEARGASLLYLKVWFRYDSLRSDPRFADLVRRVGLPE